VSFVKLQLPMSPSGPRPGTTDIPYTKPSQRWDYRYGPQRDPREQAPSTHTERVQTGVNVTDVFSKWLRVWYQGTNPCESRALAYGRSGKAPSLCPGTGSNGSSFVDRGQSTEFEEQNRKMAPKSRAKCDHKSTRLVTRKDGCQGDVSGVLIKRISSERKSGRVERLRAKGLSG
jgi:hypothetical protein